MGLGLTALCCLIGVALIVLEAMGKLPRRRSSWTHDNFGKWGLPAGYTAGAMFIVVGALLWSL